MKVAIRCLFNANQLDESCDAFLFNAAQSAQNLLNCNKSFVNGAAQYATPLTTILLQQSRLCVIYGTFNIRNYKGNNSELRILKKPSIIHNLFNCNKIVVKGVAYCAAPFTKLLLRLRKFCALQAAVNKNASQLSSLLPSLRKICSMATKFLLKVQHSVLYL